MKRVLEELIVNFVKPDEKDDSRILRHDQMVYEGKDLHPCLIVSDDQVVFRVGPIFQSKPIARWMARQLRQEMRQHGAGYVASKLELRELLVTFIVAAIDAGHVTLRSYQIMITE